MNRLIKYLFHKSPPVALEIWDTDITFKKSDETKIEKWYPDDKLYREYSRKTRNVAGVYEYKNKLKRLDLNLKDFNGQLEGYENDPDKDSRLEYDKLTLKQTIINTENEIERWKQFIYEAEVEPLEILKRWETYLENARTFIQSNNLYKYVKLNDILNSDGLYIKFKTIMDQGLSSVDKEDSYKQLALMDVYFDIKNVHYESREKRMKEFISSYNDKRFTLYDDLDFKVFGLANKIPIEYQQQVPIPEANVIKMMVID